MSALLDLLNGAELPDAWKGADREVLGAHLSALRRRTHVIEQAKRIGVAQDPDGSATLTEGGFRKDRRKVRLLHQPRVVPALLTESKPTGPITMVRVGTTLNEPVAEMQVSAVRCEAVIGHAIINLFPDSFVRFEPGDNVGGRDRFGRRAHDYADEAAAALRECRRLEAWPFDHSTGYASVAYAELSVAARDELASWKQTWEELRVSPLRRCRMPSCSVDGGRLFVARKNTRDCHQCLTSAKGQSKATRWRKANDRPAS